MRITTIAYIECTLDNCWEHLFGYPHTNNKQMWSQHRSMNDGAEVRLVDIKNDRRYFSFKRDAVVQITNNVFAFQPDLSEELAIDETKKFPKKSSIDD